MAYDTNNRLRRKRHRRGQRRQRVKSESWTLSSHHFHTIILSGHFFFFCNYLSTEIKIWLSLILFFCLFRYFHNKWINSYTHYYIIYSPLILILVTPKLCHFVYKYVIQHAFWSSQFPTTRYTKPVIGIIFTRYIIIIIYN